ncbi:FecCD family ABC transporter permease [Brachybacterium saurashtrense]|uniref:Fe(3+)-siderophore ABC transporter permease n=1 Tax=Brachybacterium saurashtrense TaxID=556288 RepID=A0A345YQ51_9MICO|nr:iron chelate uptake ABC transporter family permease subunit [Brachybacterium saurashtrense]AXK46053.1 Fe(3+)-siderophore ABC transporter permease [Brachybacterium saurashtrense]RRR23793.1 Fe(3+)-siderophore ABC transporter permease [Brachybacterium saurashtrense]
MLRIGAVSVLVRPRTVVITIVLIALALISAAAAMTVGSLPVPLGTVPGALLGGAEDPTAVRAVRGVRLPRVLSALGAGAALGVSGALFQSLARNALGSPDVIGFTTGAATGALVQIVLFGGQPTQVALGTIAGGTVTAALVLLLARSGGGMSGRQMILVGIGIGAIASALNGLLLVRGTIDTSAQANLWLSGSLDARRWSHAAPVLVGTALVLPLALALSRRASLMELGDDVAEQLGVRVERTRLLLVACAVALAALATAAVGPIAFIALAAPQLVRRLLRSAAPPLVGGASMGAVLLMLADLATQLLPVTFSVPVGRMTGVIGGLYLVWLLLPSRGSAEGKGWQ